MAEADWLPGEPEAAFGTWERGQATLTLATSGELRAAFLAGWTAMDAAEDQRWEKVRRAG